MKNAQKKVRYGPKVIFKKLWSFFATTEKDKRRKSEQNIADKKSKTILVKLFKKAKDGGRDLDYFLKETTRQMPMKKGIILSAYLMVCN